MCGNLLALDLPPRQKVPDAKTRVDDNMRDTPFGNLATLHTWTNRDWAWEEDRFAGQYVTVEAPDADEEGNLLDTSHTVARDEGCTVRRKCNSSAICLFVKLDGPRRCRY